MKILACHNHYQQAGGEDTSFALEADLLAAHGHEVIRYTLHNREIDGMGRIELARRTIWNDRSYNELLDIMRRERVDVLHCTNTFPLISPAAYYAAHDAGAAVVQSLRNYRLLCPNAQFMRDGRACEDCLGKWFAWPAIVHGCYRESRAATSVVAGMLAWHRWQGTWVDAVDMYYALTEFSREKFIEGGLPAEKIAVKPNFLAPDPGAGDGDGGYAIFVGRLSPEKGLATLLQAWSQMSENIELLIVGDGPLAGEVQAAAARDSRIQYLGSQSGDAVNDLVGRAACLVLPSVWYEGFPRTIVEAFAKGTPVIASRLGSMIEIIEPGETGLHFTAGDATDLATRVREFFASPQRHAAMRQQTRREFLTKYTAEQNYEMLLGIYEMALAKRKKELLAVAAV